MIFRIVKWNRKHSLHFFYSKQNIHNKTSGFIDASRIRNIGIMAHIDAGKTTTTERMLYFSGKIKNMGEVHKGTTVTDFMEQERNRGITITSAYVSFEWSDHLFNLVDTPGHIDFTSEVEQALNVIDSTVLVLDASAGVEVQTVTVWKQASKKNLPCLVYANKMDRSDSDILICEKSVKEKLGVSPLVLHIPLKDKSIFYGLVDLVSFKKIIWSNKGISSVELTKSDDCYSSALEKRNYLIDQLSSWDNDLADFIVDNGCYEAVTNEQLQASIHKITVSKKGVPVLCGSSYKNIGIETLLDGIIKYLPSPLEFSDYHLHELFDDDLIGKSFKVMHDKQRGPLIFFRIYNGKLEKGQKLFNFHKDKADRAMLLYKAFADETNEVPSVHQDNFTAVSGLKSVHIGDIICSSAATARKLKELMNKNTNMFERLLQTSSIPKPVVFRSVEPPSQFYQTNLEKALMELSNEDPSLKISCNEETGQTILGGMGELHLDIVKDRLKTEYKLDVEMGPLQIVYKEKPLCNITETLSLHRSIGSKEHKIEISLSLRPESNPEVLLLDTTKEARENLVHISAHNIAAIKQGIISGLSKGPLLSSEVIESHFILHSLLTNKRVPDSLLIAAASQCVNKMLKLAGTKLLEPLMEVYIVVEDKNLSLVLGDLSRRRANILNILSKSQAKEIIAEVPLSELCGYAKYLRTITSGSARFTMEFARYKEVSPEVEEKIRCGTL